MARHPQRPFTLDYIQLLFDDFQELHGDRQFANDHALIGGMGYFEKQPVMVIGIQKGRDTKQKVFRNFGMSRPEGYRKALRLMRLAAKFRRPIITLVDTPGAYPGIGAEERGQAEAIANNLKEISKLPVSDHRRDSCRGRQRRRAGHRRGRPRVHVGERHLFSHLSGELLFHSLARLGAQA